MCQKFFPRQGARGSREGEKTHSHVEVRSGREKHHQSEEDTENKQLHGDKAIALRGPKSRLACFWRTLPHGRLSNRWNLAPSPLEVSSVLDGDRSEEHTSELQSPCNLVC